MPILEAGGLKAGKDFFLAFSPEREDPGNKNFATANDPQGRRRPDARLPATWPRPSTSRSSSRPCPVSSTRVAEATKLLENTYRSVNIALVNELKMIFDRMGIDVWEVIEAATTKPFGFRPFYPGPGLGGHCIPIDPFYLTWKAREVRLSARGSSSWPARSTRPCPTTSVDKTVEALNDRGKPVKGAKVLVLGLAYKKDIDDPRESPSLKIITLFQAKGAKVDYNDPYVPHVVGHREYPGLELKSVPLTKALLKRWTPSSSPRTTPSTITTGSSRTRPLVIDTRNAVKRHSKNVVKA